MNPKRVKWVMLGYMDDETDIAEIDCGPQDAPEAIMASVLAKVAQDYGLATNTLLRRLSKLAATHAN